MADAVPVSEVPPGSEFRLTEGGEGRVWHVSPHKPLLTVDTDRHGWQRKPCPDAVRVMSRQGGTKWIPPGFLVVVVKKK